MLCCIACRGVAGVDAVLHCLQGWVQTVAAKQAYLHAVAQHRLGLVAQTNKNFGEAVARLKVCACELSM
jgi:hypothetical protein